MKSFTYDIYAESNCDTGFMYDRHHALSLDAAMRRCAEDESRGADVIHIDGNGLVAFTVFNSTRSYDLHLRYVDGQLFCTDKRFGERIVSACSYNHKTQHNYVRVGKALLGSNNRWNNVYVQVGGGIGSPLYRKSGGSMVAVWPQEKVGWSGYKEVKFDY